MFDMGASLYEKPHSYFLWPTDGRFTALVDADILPYLVGYTTDEEKYAKALLRIEEGEYHCVTETPEYEDAADQLDWTLNYWVNQAGADSAILYVTDSPGNFRLGVAFTKPYKGQRKSEKPPFFSELKAHLIENHHAIVATDCEADDLMVTELNQRNKELEQQGADIGSGEHRKFSDAIAISSDKDIRISPGWHYDPNKDDKVWVNVLGWFEPVYKTKEVINYEYWPLYNGEPMHPDTKGEPDKYSKGKQKGEVRRKRVKNGVTLSQYVNKLRGAGLKFFYSQLLVGDSADNYPGIPGVGMTRAFEVLNSCETEEEMYEAVLQEYNQALGQRSLAHNHRGGSLTLSCEQRMVEQGRLAHMRKEKGEMWRPDIYCPHGEDDVWNE
jgi:5''-3'' exonuclease (including N-terminal domain of PolI)